MSCVRVSCNSRVGGGISVIGGFDDGFFAIVVQMWVLELVFLGCGFCRWALLYEHAVHCLRSV
mgnify:CR=1 FL=1